MLWKHLPSMNHSFNKTFGLWVFLVFVIILVNYHLFGTKNAETCNFCANKFASMFLGFANVQNYVLHIYKVILDLGCLRKPLGDAVPPTFRHVSDD